MKLKHQSCSSTGLERLFECLTHHWIARSRLRSKPFGPSGRFTAWLARACRCTNLQQNRWHHATHLLWGHRTISTLPWPMQCLPKLACQIQLVQHQRHQPTPALKLLRGAHMHPRPEQFLLEKAVAMLLGEASTILLSNLRQRDDRIEHHKPTHPRIPLGACGCFAFDTDHREVQLPILLEMQVVPATDLDRSALWWVVTPYLISRPMRLGTFALKQRPIFGWRSALVLTHRNAVELAIAFEPDQHAVAQLMAGTQEFRRPIPAICQDDDPPLPKEGLEGLQLRNGDSDRGLLTADALVLQNGGPTAGLLRHHYHRRKRPADADWFVDQGQIRQVDDRAIRAGRRTRAGYVAPINGNPDGVVLCSLGQQDTDPDRSNLLDIDAPIFQRFIHTGPLALKKGRQRQFGQRLRLAFTQQGISQIEQRIGSSVKALIDVLTNVLQSVKVHYVNVLCFCVLSAKNFTLFGSLWQARAALWFPLV